MKNQFTFILVLLCVLFFGKNLQAQIPNLIITEIMYNPPETGPDSLEFIEIYNNENTSINLDGFFFSEGITHIFSGVVIEPQQFLILAKDSLTFQNTFGISAIEWESGTLSNNGELLQLSNPIGEIVDEVTYQNTAPWPTEANGFGASIVLCDYASDNSLAENWLAAISPTDFFINNTEIIANPNANSNCPIGPVLGFEGVTFSLAEQEISLYFSIILENGNANPTEVEFSFQGNSTASLDEDFTFNFSFPHSIIFPGGIENDTQLISIQLLGDNIIEANETIILTLSNPTNNAIIDPMHDEYIVIIEDNDATLPKLVISEIMYNPPENGSDSTEFIEILNNDTLAVDLVNYSFSAGLIFIFPEYILNPNEYVTICRDSIAFKNYYGASAIEWTSGSLTNSGELIELRNPGGNVADFVEYSNSSAWSGLANGMGSSLVLCDPNLDNNDPTNWSSSLNFIGNNVEGFEISASPSAENNCFVPLSPYQPRTIASMTTINNDGILDSLNQLCELEGVVYGVNLNATNGGLQFVLIDENEDGITVYANSENFGYVVHEGDEVMVHGTISQFNGLAEIIPDTLFFISNNNTLTIPQIVFGLDENTESQLIKIKNLEIINPTQWDNSDLEGFSVEVSNGMDTFEMRIDKDVDLFEMSVPNFSFNLTGLGSQYDPNAPFLDGYQIMPRYVEDLEMITSVEEIENKISIDIFPNPASDYLIMKNKTNGIRLEVFDVFGQLILAKNQILNEEILNLSGWKSGVFIFNFYGKNENRIFRILKL